ncbi:hypothetical protein HK096_009790, partial [Nowakowskiella sp. JEL0078]
MSFPSDKNQTLGKVLAIAEGAKATDAEVVVEDERQGSAGQLWTFRDGLLLNNLSGLSLGVQGGIKSGAKVIQVRVESAPKVKITDSNQISFDSKQDLVFGVVTGFFAKKEGANVVLLEKKKVDTWNERKEQRWDIIVLNPSKPVIPVTKTIATTVTTTTQAVGTPSTSSEKPVIVSLPTNVWFLIKTGNGLYATASEALVGAFVTAETLNVKDYETQLWSVTEAGYYINKKSNLALNVEPSAESDVILADPSAAQVFNYTLSHQIITAADISLAITVRNIFISGKNKLVIVRASTGDNNQMPATSTSTSTKTGPSKKKISTSIQTKIIEGAPFSGPGGFPTLDDLPENPETKLKPVGFLLINSGGSQALLGSAEAGLSVASLSAKLYSKQSWISNASGQLENTDTGELLTAARKEKGAEIVVVPAGTSTTPELSQWILTEDDAIALKTDESLVISIEPESEVATLQNYIEYLDDTPEEVIVVQRFSISYPVVVKKEVVVPGESTTVENTDSSETQESKTVEVEVLELDEANLKEAEFTTTGSLSSSSVVASKGYARFPDGWFFIYFKSQGQNFVLDIESKDVTKEGSRLILKPIALNAAPGVVKSQLWTYSGGFIVNWASGLAVDVKGGYVADDSYVVQSYTRAYRNSETQHWGTKVDGTVFLVGSEDYVFSIADETTLNPGIVSTVGTLIFGAEKKDKNTFYLIINKTTSSEAIRQAVGFLKPSTDGNVVTEVEEAFPVEIDTNDAIVASTTRRKSKRWSAWISSLYGSVTRPQTVRLANFPRGEFFINFTSWGENFVLSIENNEKAPGSKVVLRPIDKSTPKAHHYQLWSFTFDGKLQNYGSGLVIDVSNGSFVHGTKVILWKGKNEAEGNLNQVWALSESGSILLRTNPKFVLGVASPFPAGEAASALRIYESDSIEARRQLVGFLYPRYVNVEKKEGFSELTVGELTIDENAAELSLVKDEEQVTEVTDSKDIITKKIISYHKKFTCTRVTLKTETVSSLSADSVDTREWFAWTIEQKGIIYALDVADGVRAVLRALSPSTFRSQLWRFDAKGRLQNMKYSGFLTADSPSNGSGISLREIYSDFEESSFTQTWYLSDSGYLLLGPETPLAIQSPAESEFNDDPADDEFEFVPVVLVDVSEVTELLEEEKANEAKKLSVLRRFTWAPKTVIVKKVLVGGLQSELLTGTEYIDAIDSEGRIAFGKEIVITKLSERKLIKRQRFALFPGGLFLIYFISKGKDLVWTADVAARKVVLLEFDSKIIRRQLWTFVDGYLKNFESGLSVDVEGGSISADSILILSEARSRTAAATQLFGFLSSGHIFPLAADTSVITSSLKISDALLDIEKEAVSSKIGFLVAVANKKTVIERITVDGNVTTVTEDDWDYGDVTVSETSAVEISESEWIEIEKLKLKEKRTWLTSDYALLTRRNIHFIASFPRNAFFISFPSVTTGEIPQVLQVTGSGTLKISDLSIGKDEIDSQLWRYESGAIVNVKTGDSLTLNGEIEEKTSLSLAHDSAFAWGLTTESTIVLKASASFFIVPTPSNSLALGFHDSTDINNAVVKILVPKYRSGSEYVSYSEIEGYETVTYYEAIESVKDDMNAATTSIVTTVTSVQKRTTFPDRWALIYNNEHGRDFVLDANDGKIIVLKKFNIRNADPQLWRWEEGTWTNKKYGKVIAPSSPLTSKSTLELVDIKSSEYQRWRVGRNAGIVLDEAPIKLYIGSEKPIVTESSTEEIGKIILSENSENNSFGWGFRIPTFNKKVVTKTTNVLEAVRKNVVRLAKFPDDYFFVYLVSLGKHFVLDVDSQSPNAKIVFKRLDLQQPASQLWKSEGGKLVNKLTGLVISSVTLQNGGKVTQTKSKSGKESSKQIFAVNASDSTIFIRTSTSPVWVLGVQSTNTLFSKVIDVMIYDKSKTDEQKSKIAFLIPTYQKRSEKVQSVTTFEIVESEETWSPDDVFETVQTSKSTDDVEEEDEEVVTTITTYNEANEVVEHEFQEEQVVVLHPEEEIEYYTTEVVDATSDTYIVETIDEPEEYEDFEIVENGVKKIIKRIVKRTLVSGGSQVTISGEESPE